MKIVSLIKTKPVIKIVLLIINKTDHENCITNKKTKHPVMKVSSLKINKAGNENSITNDKQKFRHFHTSLFLPPEGNYCSVELSSKL